MDFIETTHFTKQVTEYLSDDEYRELQHELAARPDMGVLIQHSGGIRKVRWGLGGRGKRGGARFIYYWMASEESIYMLLIYPKNVRDDLTPEQIKVLRQVVTEEFG